MFVKNKTKVAERVVVREQSCILESCCLSPIRRNSALEELRVRRLVVIQEEICCRAFCKRLMLEWKSDGWKGEEKLCVICVKVVIWRKG